MRLLAYGINHRTTPVHIREKLAFLDTQLPLALRDFTQHNAIDEAVILSTCNRTEIYTNTSDTSSVQTWLAKQKSIGVDLNQHAYLYTEKEAVRHMMRVASGLDSMVLGEPQILGQMKQAYFAAQNAGTTGVFLNQLFPAIFSASKCIRTNTEIGSHSVTIAYAITQLTKQYYATLSDCTVLLIGAGETIELIATHLHELNIKKILIANRTLEKSSAIARVLQAEAIHIKDVPECLKIADIVISATSSQLPLIGKGLIERTMKEKSRPELLLFDLAVPRDMEPEIAQIDHVRLFHLDDLQTIIAGHLKHRVQAAQQAEHLIEQHADQFYEKMRVFYARHVISEYRSRLDLIRLQEQTKALQQLQQGHSPDKVLEQFGHSLINKIMHHPTVKLREAAAEEKCEMFQKIKGFFELESLIDKPD